MSDDETVRLADDSSGELALVVISGAAPAKHPLREGEPVTIGRASTNDVTIDSPSISRKHVKLLTKPTLRVIDLSSANGTRLDGSAIEAGVAVPLPVGRVIELGDVGIVVYRVRSVGDPASPAIGEGRIVVNEAMKELYDLAAQVAPSDLSVLILGETGAGKELVAEYVHMHSKRAKGPFLRLNCSAIAENLVESELFGHEEGAFTGATKSMPGLLECAAGGTVFLDEIGDLPSAAQAKLLRALESKEVRRVGGRVVRSIDVRFVAATHRDLKAATANGDFREDLYFRLNGIALAVPPLRDRRDEIESLAKAFVRRFSDPPPTLSNEALSLLRTYDWPGNVRELRNVMERATVLAADGTILPKHFPAELRTVSAPSDGSLKSELDTIERQRIVDALAACDGNQTKAAALLGVPRRTLLKRLDRYGIARPRKKS